MSEQTTMAGVILRAEAMARCLAAATAAQDDAGGFQPEHAHLVASAIADTLAGALDAPR